MELDKVLKESVDNVADNLFRSVTNSVSEVKAMQQRKAAENVQIVVKALKKIESDLQDKYDGITSVIEKRVSTIKDGKDGKDGKNGRDGKDGRNGKDGFVGQRGATGLDGRDGVDGQDGVSVIDANIDFDGSLIISLSNGRVINVGEVVAPDLAERIKVITNGGGTSQGVLDAIAALQATIATYGTMALQNANAVAITGGTINGTSVGATTASTGAFTTLNASGTTTLSGNSVISVTDNTNAALRITQLGTGNALLVEDSANPDATPFVIDATGQVVQGYTTAINNWNSAPDSIVSHSNSSNARPSVGLYNWSSNTARVGTYNLYKSVSNTIGTQGIVANGQQLGRIAFNGDDGVTFIRGAEIDAFVDGTPGLNDMPGGLRFLTTADGASTPTERVRINSSGNVLVTSAAGLGYGTGSGGTVTQATSRTTGVTLSKPTGAITMFSAAGSATAATFTVTNTLVAATDTIILNQKSGTNLYVLLVTAVAAGSFNVTFYTTGGVATDAPVINFSLIKGVTA